MSSRRTGPINPLYISKLTCLFCRLSLVLGMQRGSRFLCGSHTVLNFRLLYFWILQDSFESFRKEKLKRISPPEKDDKKRNLLTFIPDVHDYCSVTFHNMTEINTQLIQQLWTTVKNVFNMNL